jgi:hypothetical protein
MKIRAHARCIEDYNDQPNLLTAAQHRSILQNVGVYCFKNTVLHPLAKSDDLRRVTA